MNDEKINIPDNILIALGDLTNISIDKNHKVFIDDLLKILNGGDNQ